MLHMNFGQMNTNTVLVKIMLVNCYHFSHAVFVCYILTSVLIMEALNS